MKISFKFLNKLMQFYCKNNLNSPPIFIGIFFSISSQKIVLEKILSSYSFINIKLAYSLIKNRAILVPNIGQYYPIALNKRKLWYMTRYQNSFKVNKTQICTTLSNSPLRRHKTTEMICLNLGATEVNSETPLVHLCLTNKKRSFFPFLKKSNVSQLAIPERKKKWKY